MTNKMRNKYLELTMLTVDEKCRKNIEKCNIFQLWNYARVSKKMIKLLGMTISEMKLEKLNTLG